LVWAAYQFPSATSAKEIKYSMEIIKERLMRAFRSNRVGGESPNKRGLSEEEVIELRKVIKLGTQQNPFRRPVQFRNYVIIKLLLATGIRRGELLKLKLSHLPQGPKTTLTIERSPDDKLDSRRIEPQVKTRERNIPVLKSLSIDLWTYVQKHRKGGKHPYVFTNSRSGAPLTSVGLNWIFDVLVRKCFPNLKGRLHPHIMRHTFNDGIMMQAIALGWSDDQRRKTQTYLNGWNEGSNMTEVYSRRIIEMKAMEIAEAYQKGLYIF
jgi:integrase